MESWWLTRVRARALAADTNCVAARQSLARAQARLGGTHSRAGKGHAAAVYPSLVPFRPSSRPRSSSPSRLKTSRGIAGCILKTFDASNPDLSCGVNASPALSATALTASFRSAASAELARPFAPLPRLLSRSRHGLGTFIEIYPH